MPNRSATRSPAAPARHASPCVPSSRPQPLLLNSTAPFRCSGALAPRTLHAAPRRAHRLARRRVLRARSLGERRRLRRGRAAEARVDGGVYERRRGVVRGPGDVLRRHAAAGGAPRTEGKHEPRRNLYEFSVPRGGGQAVDAWRGTAYGGRRRRPDAGVRARARARARGLARGARGCGGAPARTRARLPQPSAATPRRRIRAPLGGPPRATTAHETLGLRVCVCGVGGAAAWAAAPAPVNSRAAPATWDKKVASALALFACAPGDQAGAQCTRKDHQTQGRALEAPGMPPTRGADGSKKRVLWPRGACGRAGGRAGGAGRGGCRRPAGWLWGYGVRGWGVGVGWGGARGAAAARENARSSAAVFALVFAARRCRSRRPCGRLRGTRAGRVSGGSRGR